MQTYDEYDEYACDMACYNSKLFLDKGTPEIDTTEVFNEYMRLSRGHAHQKIVRDYAMRSGEMLDWMVGHIPAEYVEKYAKTSNYKGNDNFNGECCGPSSRGRTLGATGTLPSSRRSRSPAAGPREACPGSRWSRASPWSRS